MALSAALLLGAAAPADAQLTGGTVGLQYRFPDPSVIFADFGTAVVGPGVEFPDQLGLFSVDVTDGMFVASFLVPAVYPVSPIPGTGFGGFFFYDAGGTLAAFTAATVNASTTIAFDPARIFVFDDVILVDLQGVAVTQGSVLAIDVSQVPVVSTVPEPATVALVGGGLLGVFGIRRRRTAA